VIKAFLLHSNPNYSSKSDANNILRIRNKRTFSDLRNALQLLLEGEKNTLIIENCLIDDKESSDINEFLAENREGFSKKRIVLLNCTNSDKITKKFSEFCSTQKKKNDTHSLIIENCQTAQEIIKEFSQGFNSNISLVHLISCNLYDIKEIIELLEEVHSITSSLNIVFEKCYGPEENIEKLGSFFRSYEVKPKIQVKINEKAEKNGIENLFNFENLGNMANMLAGAFPQNSEETTKSPGEKQKELKFAAEKFSLSPSELEAQFSEKYKQNLEKAGDNRAMEKNKLLSQLPTFSVPKLFRNIKLADEEIAELKGIFTNMLLSILNKFIVGNPSLKEQLADVFIEGIDSGKFETNFLIYGYPGTGKSQMGCGLAACMALIDLYEEALKIIDVKKSKIEHYIEVLNREDIINAAVESYQRYFVLIPLNSCNDLPSLFGSPSVFSGAGAGMFIKKMAECNQFFKQQGIREKYPKVNFPEYISSPICVLDEIDKFNLTVNVQNSEEKSKETLSNILDKIIGEIKDEFVDIRIPSRYIFFLSTANDISRLNSGFLGSRLPRKSELEGYTIQEKKNILIKKLFMDMVNSRSTDINLSGFHEEEKVFKNNIISVEKEALGKIVQLLSTKDLGIRLLQTLISNFLTNISKHISEEALKKRSNPSLKKKPTRVIITTENVLDYISSEIIRNNILSDENREMWRKGSISVISKSSKKDGAVEELTAILAQKHLGVSGGYYLITLLGGTDERDNRQMPLEISSYVTSLLTHTAKFRRDFQNFVSQQKLFNLMTVNIEGPQPFSARELPSFAFCAALCVISILMSQPIRQDTIYLGFVDNQGVLFKDTAWKSKLILIGGSMAHIKHIILPKKMQDDRTEKFMKEKLDGREIKISYCSHFNELVDIFISPEQENVSNQEKFSAIKKVK
jgi:hypothetical protein